MQGRGPARLSSDSSLERPTSLLSCFSHSTKLKRRKGKAKERALRFRNFPEFSATFRQARCSLRSDNGPGRLFFDSDRLVSKSGICYPVIRSRNFITRNLLSPHPNLRITKRYIPLDRNLSKTTEKPPYYSKGRLLGGSPVAYKRQYIVSVAYHSFTSLAALAHMPYHYRLPDLN